MYEFKCSMCFFSSTTNDHLMRHIIRHHLNDPQFKVQCSHHGCNCTFRKWRTFRQHIFRKHRLNQNIVEDLRNERERDDVMDKNEPLSEINDEDYEEELFIDSEERMTCYAAQFLVNIRENSKVSQKAIGTIIDGVTFLVDIYTSVILEKIYSKVDTESNMIKKDDITSIFHEECPSSMIFSTIQTKDALDQVLITKLSMVPSKCLTIAKGLTWKRKKNVAPIICRTDFNAEIVPFLSSLKNLLSNEEIRSYINNQGLQNDNILRTVLDGQYYNSNEFFKDNRNSLAIIFYYDDICMANTVGASAKKHKYSTFYWILGNLNPKVRSSLHAIQLYAVVKTEYLKKPNAFNKLLKPFIEDINSLKNTGIDIDVGRGQIRNYKGSLLFCSGDTPALAMLRGFKESTAAHRPCRSCQTTNNVWKSNFRDSDFTPRTIEIHQEVVDIIDNATITPTAKKFWQKFTGVNKRSPLMDIEHFDISQCLPQDVMHILIEGPLEISCRLYLLYCIKILELFTLNEFNHNLINFDYKHFRKDKPAPIEPHHLQLKASLRQSAAQLLTLAHVLPFLIAQWTMTCENIHLIKRTSCFIELLQIVNIVLAYEINRDSIDLLTFMINLCICNFNELYPDCLIPKFHFLIHVPRYIHLFGPARQQWCFRFEGLHAYFKGLMPVVRNYKNVPITLAYRHQARLCSKLSSYPGAPAKKFIYQGDKVIAGMVVFLEHLPDARLFHEFIDEAEWLTCEMMLSPKVVIFGTSYQPNNIILLECNKNDMPVFGEIKNIFIYDNKKLLLLLLYTTENFNSKLNAYKISRCLSNEKSVINIETLIFPHELSFFDYMSSKYVPLLNHQRVKLYHQDIKN